MSWVVVRSFEGLGDRYASFDHGYRNGIEQLVAWHMNPHGATQYAENMAVAMSCRIPGAEAVELPR